MLIAFLLGIISPVDGQVVEAKANPTNATQSEENGIPTNRIIVKYKDGTSAPFTPSYTPQQIEDRVSAASAVELDYVRPMGEGDAHVLQLPERMPIAEVEAITQQIETLPEIEYAEPDRIYTVALDPNDIAYDNDNQWNLNGTWGINAPSAWDLTQGSSSVVVAVVDTGYTEHPELDGRLIEEGGDVYGYDFISFATEANDGNGRDTDPSDPGDWITDAENDDAPFVGCPVTDSTWHGTHVAGIIGAQTNNGADIAGIDWNAKILPVRVLGKCGGYLSDIADGMRWAAGLTVSGVSANLHPADIINLSLGGPGTCSLTEQNAITAIVEAGVVVVAAAGNDNINVSGYSPANCNGVISVAATDIAGQKAGYSNFGAGIHISAPGGDEDDEIVSTSNTGTTVPVDDALEEKSGTSMAAPHVSGVLALMFAVNPNLNPDQALQLLQNTAKGFPGGGSCNTTNCGSGIVDAAAAVAAAAAPDLIVTGYELRNEANNAVIAPADINDNEAFHIRLSIKNQGGDNAGLFYPGVFLDGKPNYGPDNDDYPFGQITYFNDFKIIYGSNGCLAYDPEENLDPMGDTCNAVRGNYTVFDFPPPLPAGASTTVDVYIGYTEEDYPNPDYDAVDVRTGLPDGNYQIYLYADPSGTVEESIEDNNEYGPIILNIDSETYPPTLLVNSVLPTSRTPYVGSPVTIYNTVINAGAYPASGVTLSMVNQPPGTFSYRQSNCSNNSLIGGINPSITIASGAVACYVLTFTPSAPFAASNVHIRAQASNAAGTNLLLGINTWLLRATSSAGPDIIALTTTTDFHQIACSGTKAFAVASSNVGTATTGNISVTANTGSTVLPLSISISETNPSTGVIIGDHILENIGAGENRTVVVFVTFHGCVSFDPANKRIFIEFRDASNNVVGSTSTAVSTNR